MVTMKFLNEGHFLLLDLIIFLLILELSGGFLFLKKTYMCLNTSGIINIYRTCLSCTKRENWNDLSFGTSYLTMNVITLRALGPTKDTFLSFEGLLPLKTELFCLLLGITTFISGFVLRLQHWYLGKFILDLIGVSYCYKIITLNKCLFCN